MDPPANPGQQVVAIVSNTGPILHLYQAGLLDLLPTVGNVCTTPAVEDELGQLLPNWVTPGWLPIRAPTAYASQSQAWVDMRVIHRSEAEAVAVARELNADWFLTDDNGARLLAGSIGIEVHGSLAVVLEAARVGTLDRAAASLALAALQASSLWVFARVFEGAEATLAMIWDSDD